MIKGLTLAQPWALKFEIGALVENRDWSPPKNAIGQYLALHGGKSKTFRAIEQDLCFILGDAIKSPEREWLSFPDWLIEHLIWFKGKNDKNVLARDIQIEGVFAVAKLERVVTSKDELPEDQKKWFFGRYGWVFSDYVSLGLPVPCRGALGLWDLDDEILKQVRSEYVVSRENHELSLK